ncbi:hypothetical protein [Chryseobacterium indologenes]|nr:hypothetical protein [Chryseobacterium indologenes]
MSDSRRILTLAGCLPVLSKIEKRWNMEHYQQVTDRKQLNDAR